MTLLDSTSPSPTPADVERRVVDSVKRGYASVYLRRLLGYLKPHRARMAVALVSLLLSAGFGLVFPHLIVELLEGIESTRDAHFLNLIALTLVGVFLLQAAFGFLENYLLTVVGEKVVTELRRSLYAHLHTLSLEFFGRRRVGELVSRLSSDVDQVRHVLTTNIGVFVGQLATLIGALVVMLNMNVRLTLFMLALAPPAVLVGLLFSRKIERASGKVQERLADSTAIAEQGLRGVAVVKSFGAEHMEAERYRKATADTLQTSLKMAKYSALFTSLMNYLAFCSIAAIIWYGGREVLAERLSAAKVTGFLIYGIIIAGSIGQLAGLFGQLSAALGAVKRVFELLDTRPLVTDVARPLELGECRGQITLSNVSFSYPDGAAALDGVSLDVQPGEIIALVGPSGAGKSTLFNLIPRFYDATSGSVSIDGRDVRSLAQSGLRARIAIVPQEIVLFRGTVRDNLLYGRPDACMEEVVLAARAANAHDFIMNLPDGYEHVIQERGLNLSGGQRQRIAIARAILKDPKILLLDEATSALDNESERLVQEALNRLMRQGRTTIIVAHRLSTIRVAHRIAVLADRKLVELGTHHELMRLNGLYARLYQMQSRQAERHNTEVSASGLVS